MLEKSDSYKTGQLIGINCGFKTFTSPRKGQSAFVSIKSQQNMPSLLHFTAATLSQYACFFGLVIKILRAGANSSEQIVQTQISLLPKEQSDQGLYCLQFLQNLLDALLH